MTNVSIKLLLIEDDEDDYLLIRDLLRQALGTQHELDRIGDFDQALETIIKRLHDVYLIDYRLGARNGLNLMRSAIFAGCKAPIIMLTGQGAREIDIEAMASGAADYLIKRAITVDSLERAIRYAVTRNAAETALRKSEQQSRIILSNIEEAVYLITRGEDGRWPNDVSFVSDAVQRLIGYAPQEFLIDGKLLFRIIHTDDLQAVKRQIKARFSSAASSTLKYRITHKVSGQTLWIEDKVVPQFNDAGQVVALVGILRDFTQPKALQDKLFHAAFQDRLTGLPNRTLFMDRLGNTIRRGRRTRHQYWAVLLLDMNRFKAINDSLGHEVGDHILICTARRLRECLRAGDTLARLGGDEFVVLLEDVSPEHDAHGVCMRIHKMLRKPHFIGEHQVICTASIGIARGKPSYEHPEEVLHHAGTAMYDAKASQRDSQVRAKSYQLNMRTQNVATQQRACASAESNCAPRTNARRFKKPTVTSD